MQKSDALSAMWREYKRTSSVALRNQLVETYLPLVDFLSERIADRLPRHVGLDEVRSAGVLGLLDAIEGFDLTRGIKFETYCSIRVRGSILDELRSRDWVPRLVRSRTQKFALAVRRLAGELGRKPTSVEVATSLNLTSEEYDRLQNDMARLAIYSLSSSDNDDRKNVPGAPRSSALADHRHPDPAAMLSQQQAAAIALDELSDRGLDRTIVELYYLYGLTMKEIGFALGLSESRVCQIHGESIERLQESLSHRRSELFL